MRNHKLNAMATVTTGMSPIAWMMALAILLTSCSRATGQSNAPPYRIAGSDLPATAPVEPLSHFTRLGVPIDAVTGHRATRSVRLDRGDLRVGPPGGGSAAVSLETATRLVRVAMVNQQASYNPALVALASVTISISGAGGVPTYRNRLAWVGFLTRRPGGTSCGGLGGGSSTPFVYVEPFGAVVLDARTGESPITYWSRGTGVCGGSSLLGPFVHKAYEVLSVPWTLTGQQAAATPANMPPGAPVSTRPKLWSFRYTMPPCGANWDSGGYYRHGELTGFFIEVQVPIDRNGGQCRPSRTLTGQFSTAIPAGHAPVGIVVGGAL